MRRAIPITRQGSDTIIHLRGVCGRDVAAAGNGGSGQFDQQNQRRRDDLVRYRAGLQDAATAEARAVFDLFGTVDEILSHAFRYGQNEFLLSARHARRIAGEQGVQPAPLIVEVSPAPRGLTKRTILTHRRSAACSFGHAQEAAE